MKSNPEKDSSLCYTLFSTIFCCCCCCCGVVVKHCAVTYLNTTAASITRGHLVCKVGKHGFDLKICTICLFTHTCTTSVFVVPRRLFKDNGMIKKAFNYYYYYYYHYYYYVLYCLCHTLGYGSRAVLV